jgi:hypothetical protein
MRHVCSPHFIDPVGDDRPIVWLGLGASNAMRGQAALPEATPQIKSSIAKLGFKLADIKYLLNTTPTSTPPSNANEALVPKRPEMAYRM